MMRNKSYIPALKFHWLTRFYDPLVDRSGSVKKLRKALLEQAKIGDNDLILDFGCGTASLTIMAKRRYPKAIFHGLDIDPNVMRIAQKKAKDSGHLVLLKEYEGGSLPYKNEMFDQVLSSLVFHHLNRNQKSKALKEIYRVLKPGGGLHIADFGRPKNIFMRGMFLPIQLFDGFDSTDDNIKGLLPKLIKGADFKEVLECRQMNSIFGTISLYRAIKP